MLSAVAESPFDLIKPTQFSACVRSVVRSAMTSGQPIGAVCAQPRPTAKTKEIAAAKANNLPMTRTPPPGKSLPGTR